MIKVNKLILIIIILVLSIIGILIYESLGEKETIRARIVKKYEKTTMSLIPLSNGVIVPVFYHHYYFVMDNGDIVEVSYSDYLNYNIGDIYEYQKRKG